MQDGLRTAKRLGVTVSLDVNYRSSLWPASKTQPRTGRTPARRGCPGRDAARRGGSVRYLWRGRGQRRLCASASACARGLYAAGRVGASDGSFSGLLCDAEGVHESRRYNMQFVDRVGGGDAFTAGLIYGLLSQWPARHTIEFAAAAGCLKHSIPGDFNLVSFEEVQALANGAGTGSIQR